MQISEINDEINDIKIEDASLDDSKSMKTEIEIKDCQTSDSTDQTTEEQQSSISGLLITDVVLERRETTNNDLEVRMDLIKKNMEEYKKSEIVLETINAILNSPTIKKFVEEQEDNVASTSNTSSNYLNRLTLSRLKIKPNTKAEINDQNATNVETPYSSKSYNEIKGTIIVAYFILIYLPFSNIHVYCFTLIKQ